MTNVVRGNYTSRAATFAATYDRTTDSSSVLTMSVIDDRITDASTTSSTTIRDRGAEGGSAGYLQGIAFEAPTSLDGQGSFGRHMQVGINKDVSIGNPSAPSLRLDYPGFWRFRYVVRPGTRKVSIITQQNSTGSYRPTVVVKSNPSIGLMADVSASAADVPGWTTVGPVTFAVTGTDVVWVELHNNNYGMPNLNGSLISTPAYFDHIVVS